MQVKMYSVYRCKDDSPVIIYATSKECAEAMGIKLHSFYRHIVRTRKEEHKHRKWSVYEDEMDGKRRVNRSARKKGNQLEQFVTPIPVKTAQEIGRNLAAMIPARIASLGLKNWNESKGRARNMNIAGTTNTAEIDKPQNN